MSAEVVEFAGSVVEDFFDSSVEEKTYTLSQSQVDQMNVLFSKKIWLAKFVGLIFGLGISIAIAGPMLFNESRKRAKREFDAR